MGVTLFHSKYSEKTLTSSIITNLVSPTQKKNKTIACPHHPLQYVSQNTYIEIGLHTSQTLGDFSHTGKNLEKRPSELSWQPFAVQPIPHEVAALQGFKAPQGDGNFPGTQLQKLILKLQDWLFCFFGQMPKLVDITQINGQILKD